MWVKNGVQRSTIELFIYLFMRICIQNITKSCSFCKSRPLLSKRKDRNILIELWSQCREYNYWCVDVGLVSPSDRGEVSWQPLSNQNNDILVRTEIRRSAYSPEGRQTNYTLGSPQYKYGNILQTTTSPHHVHPTICRKLFTGSVEEDELTRFIFIDWQELLYLFMILRELFTK